MFCFPCGVRSRVKTEKPTTDPGQGRHRGNFATLAAFKFRLRNGEGEAAVLVAGINIVMFDVSYSLGNSFFD